MFLCITWFASRDVINTSTIRKWYEYIRYFVIIDAIFDYDCRPWMRKIYCGSLYWLIVRTMDFLKNKESWWLKVDWCVLLLSTKYFNLTLFCLFNHRNSSTLTRNCTCLFDLIYNWNIWIKYFDIILICSCFISLNNFYLTCSLWWWYFLSFFLVCHHVVFNNWSWCFGKSFSISLYSSIMKWICFSFKQLHDS